MTDWEKNNMARLSIKKEPLALESQIRKVCVCVSQTSLCSKEERIVNVFILKSNATIVASIKC